MLCVYSLAPTTYILPLDFHFFFMHKSNEVKGSHYNQAGVCVYLNHRQVKRVG